MLSGVAELKQFCKDVKPSVAVVAAKSGTINLVTINFFLSCVANILFSLLSNKCSSSVYCVVCYILYLVYGTVIDINLRIKRLKVYTITNVKANSLISVHYLVIFTYH